MDEGFLDLPRARWRCKGNRQTKDIKEMCRNDKASKGKHIWPSLLNQRRVLSAVEPPRPIPNRVVKRCSAAGTGGCTAGRQGPRAHHSFEFSVLSFEF